MGWQIVFESPKGFGDFFGSRDGFQPLWPDAAEAGEGQEIDPDLQTHENM